METEKGREANAPRGGSDWTGGPSAIRRRWKVEEGWSSVTARAYDPWCRRSEAPSEAPASRESIWQAVAIGIPKAKLGAPNWRGGSDALEGLFRTRPSSLGDAFRERSFTTMSSSPVMPSTTGSFLRFLGFSLSSWREIAGVVASKASRSTDGHGEAPLVAAIERGLAPFRASATPLVLQLTNPIRTRRSSRPRARDLRGRTAPCEADHHDQGVRSGADGS